MTKPPMSAATNGLDIVSVFDKIVVIDKTIAPLGAQVNTQLEGEQMPANTTADNAARMANRAAMLDNQGLSPLLLLDAGTAQSLLHDLENTGVSGFVAELPKGLAKGVFRNCLGEAVGAATVVCLHELDSSFPMNDEAQEAAVAAGLAGGMRLASGETRKAARELRRQFEAEGRSPSQPTEYGTLLLGERKGLPHPADVDLWDTLDVAVKGAAFRRLIEDGPRLVKAIKDNCMEVGHAIEIPTAEAPPADWSIPQRRLDRWLHLRRRGTHLPFPFVADDLAAALLTGTCPPSLARRIHDLAVAEIPKEGDDVNPAHVFPDLVVGMLKIATAALVGWDDLRAYFEFWMGAAEDYPSAVFRAVKGALMPLEEPLGKHGTQLKLETLKSSSRFTELRKLLYSASVQDDVPIDGWDDNMPGWARTIVLLGLNLAGRRKHPRGVRSGARRGRPPLRPGPGLFTIKEAAEAASTSTPTIRRWIAEELIPPPARIPAGHDKSRWQIVFTPEQVEDLRTLALSTGAIGQQLGVTDRTVRRRLITLKKRHPGATRLELRKLLLEEVS